MNVSGLLCFRVLRRSVLARGAVPSAVYGAHLFLSVLAPLVTELGGEGYPIPPVRYRLADEPLVGKGPVPVGRVEEGDANIDSPVYRSYRLTRRWSRRTRSSPYTLGPTRRGLAPGLQGSSLPRAPPSLRSPLPVYRHGQHPESFVSHLPRIY
jgi:hypothetical protein